MNPQPLIIGHQTGAFRVANRWFDDHYLHVEHNALEVGLIQSHWQSAIWDIAQVSGEAFVTIFNHWQSSCCLQTVDGEFVYGHSAADATCSHWYLERVKGNPCFRLRHRSSGDHYLHFEDRTLQVGAIDPAWWSAQWDLQHAGLPLSVAKKESVGGRRQ